jgi:uncharacterized OB-fold protein
MNAPLPIMTDLTAQFYGHLATGTLHLQRCGTCGLFRHLPRYLCAACYSQDWAWAPCSGEGAVVSWTTTMRSLHPAFVDLPMTLVTVAMAEGPRILGQLDGAAPEAIRSELPVVIAPLPLANGIAIPRFRPHRAGTNRFLDAEASLTPP